MAEQALSRPVQREGVSNPPRRFASKRFQENLTSIIATVIVTIGALIILFPVVWMLSTSLKGQVEAMKMPPNWIPAQIQWHNYYDALTFNRFDLYFLNTTYYAVMVMVAEAVSCSFIAFGFARLRAPGKNLLFMFVLATLMLPEQVTLIPRYILFVSYFGWRNTYWPMIVPAWFGSAYLIFLVRQFYMTIPKEYDEAALIEGANWLTIWWRIMVPLSKPVIGAMAIMSFMFHWNDYLRPLIYIDENKLFPVSLGLSMFQAPFGGTPLHWLMAASLTAVLPCIIIFFFAQRFFMQGIVVSGVKG
jgi:ABC-type glycerol-3-phosphate transport system permease component